MEEKAQIILKFTSDNPYLLNVFRMAPRLFTVLHALDNINVTVEEIFQGVLLFVQNNSELEKIFKLADKILNSMIEDSQNHKSSDIIRFVVEFIKVPLKFDLDFYYKETARIVTTSNGYYLMKELSEKKVYLEFNRGNFYKYSIFKLLGEKISA